MKKTNKALSKKDEIFCLNYAHNFCPREAAEAAGYPGCSDKIAAQLLAREDICNRIKEIFNISKQTLIYKAYKGYEKLAFGDVSDAAMLIYSQNLDIKNIKTLDLFNVSEIKKTKDSGMEIKFFDRLKALEKLQQIDLADEKEGQSFYGAIEKAAHLNQYENNSF